MQLTIPVLGENVQGGDVVRVLVGAGDQVLKDQPVIELETDKAVVEIPATQAGRVKEVLVKVGAKVKVGQPIMEIEAGEPASDQSDKSESDKSDRIMASPSVRKLAREFGIDLARVQATGPGGRVTADDVKNFSRESANRKYRLSPVITVDETQAKEESSRFGEVEVRPMSSMRRKTAKTMSLSWGTIPHVTQFDNADITEVLKLRKRYAPRVEKAGGKLTITAIILKVTASALKVFPQFNASINMEAEQIIFKKYCHIGVAVDTERGLIVPVIREVDKKNIMDLSLELNAMAARARERKTALGELQGGTFTITNLGGLGTTYFSPIINPPEVAILGVGRAREEPVYQEGQWVPKSLLPLSLSYDHRLIDGADAARFLRWIAEALQEPFLMDLEG